MSDLLERLKDAEANNRPHPFARIDGTTAVAPVYAVHAHDVTVLMLEISNRDARIAELEMQVAFTKPVELAQNARIAELKAALKPFADKATVYPDLPDNWLAHVTMKHLRAARAAYLGEKE